MNIPDGKQSWHDWITSAESSADRFGDRDVVPASMAREIAARLDQCYLDRKARHEQARVAAQMDAIENADRVLAKIQEYNKRNELP